MSKLNPTLSVILIDTSYWLYYRFFSLRNWYAHAYPEKYINKNKNEFNMEYNWLEDELFMTKYKKLFVDNIKKICKKYKTKMENVVFCIDCTHNDIWRHKIVNSENEKINKINEEKKQKKTEPEPPLEPEPLPEPPLEPEPEPLPEPLIEPYKGTRKASHKKNNFNSFNIFSYMKKSFIPLIKDNNNNTVKIMYCSCCEADDIIGHLSLYIENKWQENITNTNTPANTHAHTHAHTPTKKINIYILASDNDYLQVCNNNIKLINGIGKIISSEKDTTMYGDNYLLSKTLLGDKSDNIKCCTIDTGYIDTVISNTKYKNISKKYLKKIFENPETYNVFINILNDIRNNKLLNDIENKNIININKFAHNCTMMDFKMLPQNLKDKLYNLFNEIL